MVTLPREVQNFSIFSDIVFTPHFEVKSNCILLSICDLRSDEVTENLHFLIHQRQTHSQSWLADINFIMTTEVLILSQGFLTLEMF